MLRKARHRDVRDHATAMIQHLRVDDAADRSIHRGITGKFDERLGIGSLDREFAEARQIDDANRFAHCAMLFADELEEGRLAPAPGALIGAHATPRLAGIDVVSSLEARLDTEHGAGLLETTVQGGKTRRATPLVLIERIAEAVVVAVGLLRRNCCVLRIAVDRTETPRPIARHVELGLAGRNPLGNRLANTTRATKAIQRQPCGHPETRHTRHRSKQWVAVGRHRIGMADQADDTGLLEEGEAPNRTLHQLCESLLARRQRTRTVLPRHTIDPPRRCVGLVAAEENAARLGLAVDEIIGIAEARHVAWQLEAIDCVERNVLMIDRRRRHPRANHRGDPRCPHARGIDDTRRCDAILLCHDSGDLAMGTPLDRRDAAVLLDLDAELAGGVRQRVGCTVWIKPTVLRDPKATEEALGRRRRHLLQRLLGRQEVDLHANPASARGTTLHLGELLG